MLFNTTPRAARVALLTTFIFLAAAVPAVLAQKGDMPLTANKEAKALFMQARAKGENIEDTGTMFDQVIRKDPNFAFGYIFAGQTNREAQANIDTAVKLADKASPGEREWIFAARDANNGDIAGQLSHLLAAEKLYPGDKRIHMALANYYRGQGDDATALTHLNHAAKIDKKFAPAYNLIGYTNIVLGNNAAAEAAFQHYIKLIPNNANPYDSYAEFLLNSGKFDESIKQYNMALAKDPTFVNSYEGMGNAYEYKGDFATAREKYQMMYDKAASPANRALALSSMSNSYVAEGKIDKAVEVNAKRIAQATAEGDVGTVINLHNQSGFLFLSANDVKGAAMEFETARSLENDPSLRPERKGNRDFNSNVQRARYAIATSDFAGAAKHVDALGEYAAGHPAFAPGYNAMAGNLQLAQKNYSKANEFYAKGSQQDVYLLFCRAQSYEGLGDAANAKLYYQKVANWNQLDTTGYALVRRKAVAKLKN